jgi:(p)ppGpp synthase/HD superfamily hydrolase
MSMAPLSARTLEDAIALATHAHRGQQDKAGAPYILHPLRVMFRLGPDATEHERMAAVLHDVIEDTPYKQLQLGELGCPASVLSALDCLTRRHDETYEQFIERVLPNRIARKVKRADLEDNMDLTRIASLSAKDLDRLQRYRAAWTRVTEASSLKEAEN